MRTRRKEIERIADMLSEQHSDVEDLAEQVWRMIDQMRREREVYVVGVNYAGVGQFLFGPYDSRNAAETDLSGRGAVRSLSEQDTFRIFRGLSYSELAKQIGDEQQELFDLR